MTRSEIQHVREEVAGMCDALTSPDPGEIAAQLVGLDQALRQLSAWQNGAEFNEEDRGVLRAELEALQADLQRTERLVRNGEDFWRGWARLLGMDTGYTPSGMPGVIEATHAGAAARMKVEG